MADAGTVQYHRRTTSATSVHAFFEWLGLNWERGMIGPASEANSKNVDEDRCFLPSSKLREYFDSQPQTLRKLLKAVCPSAVEDDQIGESTVQRYYIQVFAILLFIDEAESIPHFVMHHSLADNRLPFEETAPDKFPYRNIPDRNFYPKFFRAQWKFCVEPMRWSRRIELNTQCILPILSRTRLDEGGFAVTYRIKIHPDYNELREYDVSCMSPDDPEYNTFVLKTYEDTEEAHYENEVSAFLKLQTRRYILEWANRGTLENYFQRESPPRNISDKYKFWSSILGLLGALKRIHESRNAEDDKLVGWHQDVKPDNILVCKSAGGSVYDCEFKLADLGLSHFKTKKKENSSDVDLRGTLTYGAPECYRPDEFSSKMKINVTPLVDVWSFGCVLSEAVTWVTYGLHDKYGLDQYRQNRLDQTRGIASHRDQGCFHNGSEVLPIVSQQHAKLRLEMDTDDKISRDVLHLSDRMLWHSDHREPSSKLHTQAITILGTGPPVEPPREDASTAELGSDQGPRGKSPRSSNMQQQPLHLPWPVESAKAWRKMKKATSNCSDELRPGLRRELKHRDFILIIDDSSTMLKHWDQVVETVDLLAFVLKDFDSNGIDLIFTNDDEKQTRRDVKYLTDLVRRKRPDSGQEPANLNLSLGRTLMTYNSEMGSNKNKTNLNLMDRALLKISRMLHPVKPSIVYVLTDGLWQPGDEIESYIKNLLDTLISARCQGDQFGVQFIQFGRLEQSTRRLRALDLVRSPRDSKKDITDREPADGDFRKMLIGAVNRWYDDDYRDQQAMPGSSQSAS